MTHDNWSMRTLRPLPPITVGVSYSGGVSEWLLHAVLRGILPRPQHFAFFFADTGLEHVWTYENVLRVETLCQKEGIDFIRCARDEDLSTHLLAINEENRTRADHPPVWIAKDGGGRGQAEHRCTREFKVAPMRRAQSVWLKSIGVQKQITKWIGFGADEIGRAIKADSKRDVQWEKLDYPLIRLGVSRAQQHADVERWTGKKVRFSMCTICPWKSTERWLATPPAQLEKVYEIDAAIRDLSNVGLTDGDAFLTSQLIPVEQLVKRGDPQPYLPGIDAGCDGGHCFI